MKLLLILLLSTNLMADTLCPVPGTSNEPAGLTKIEDRAFNCIGGHSSTCETNWVVAGANNIAIVQDATAPKSPNNVAQMTYTTSLPGGSGPATEEYNLSPTKSTLYIATWIKFSTTWQAHPTSVNKELHFFINGSNKLFAMAYGTDPQKMLAAMGLQGLTVPFNDGRGHIDTSVNLLPNLVPNAYIKLGVWQKHEYLITANTAGKADGAVDYWLDGVHILSYSGIGFYPVAGTWGTIKWDPTWGGAGGTIKAPFTMQMDHFYLSGK